jgi:hypothetical protein
MLLIQTNKQTDKKKLTVFCAGSNTRHSSPSIQPSKNVLPRNNFQTYNTFWKQGEATDKQQGIWFVWLVQITKCEVIFISVRFTQQSILSLCPTHLPPTLPFLRLCAPPFPSLPSLPTESWHFFSAAIPSLLNSSLLKFSFHFVIALALIFLPTHSPHFLLYSTSLSQLIPFLSFSITIFPFFLRHQMLVQFTQSRRQAGRQHALLSLRNRPQAEAL